MWLHGLLTIGTVIPLIAPTVKQSSDFKREIIYHADKSLF